MCETMQKIVDRERDDAAIKARMDIALSLCSEGEHDLDKIAKTTKLSIEQVRRAITEVQPVYFSKKRCWQWQIINMVK